MVCKVLYLQLMACTNHNFPVTTYGRFEWPSSQLYESCDSFSQCNQLTGLTAVETGGINTIQPLIVSALNGLPCLDVAGMGRSYPVLEMFMPFMCGSNWCPASLANDNKESVTCVAVESCAKLEQFFRSLTGNLP